MEREVDLADVVQDARLPEHQLRLPRELFLGNRLQPLSQRVPAPLFEHLPAHPVGHLYDPLPAARLDVVIDRLFPLLGLLHQLRAPNIELSKALGLLAA